MKTNAQAATTSAHTTSDVILSVRNLTKHYPIRRSLFSRTQSVVHALEDVSFDVHRGETFGNKIETVIISANEKSELAKLKEVDIVIRSSDKFSQNEYSIQPMGSLFEQMLLLILDYMVYILYSDRDIESLKKNHANLE